MEPIQPIINALKSAQSVAIILPEELNLDALCAGFAMQNALNRSGSTKATLFTSAHNIPETSFLHPSPMVKNSFSQGDQLVIKISNRNTEPKEIKYEKVSDGLVVTVGASGELKETDVSVLPSMTNFDLVVVIGAANLELLGQLYTANTKLFFSVPIVNIDIDPGNEYFSKLNLVNPLATSLCEIVMDVVEEFALKNESVSTALLAGIISATNSFRDPKITPNVLEKASRLVSVGAKQQEIIQYLFKTKSLQQLQLWGRALARLTEYPDKQILIAVLTKSDIEKTQSKPEALPEVCKDIIEMVTGYSLVVLIAEDLQVLVVGLPHENIAEFAKKITESAVVSKPQLLVGQYEFVTFTPDLSLLELQQKLTALVQAR